jgi:hypothetical protein
MNIFEVWEQDMERWRRKGTRSAIPVKPPGYDLWKQGPDPLGLETAPSIPCAGGELVSGLPVLSSAKPPAHHPPDEQLPLL